MPRLCLRTPAREVTVIKIFNHYFHRRTVLQVMLDMGLVVGALILALYVQSNAALYGFDLVSEGLSRGILMALGMLAVNSALGFYERSRNKSTGQMRARAVLSADTCMWHTVPFRVSSATGPMTASGARRRMMSMDAFLRLMGRGDAVSKPVRGSSKAISSDSRRQPSSIKAAHSVLLPEPGGAGRITARPSRSSTAECKVIQLWQ